jgi:hypothetical protein
MKDWLVCPTPVELAGSKQLIRDNFPFPVSRWTPEDSHDEDGYSCGFAMPEDVKPWFVRWALEDHNGLYVVRYCWRLSVVLLDPPRWMKAILEEQSIKRLWNASS